jgi:3-oxoacyl-[acyl-carrier protein] reductase
MDLGLEGRVAVVTAASRGLGRASAVALGEEGVRTVLCARSQQDLEAVSSSLGSESVVVPGDLAHPGLPDRLVETALERFGRLDILVANNGGPPKGRAIEVSDEQLLAALEGNLLVSVRLARAALKPMRAQAWGRICMIASGSVKQPMPNLALSNTARPGLWGWAKTAAAEVAHEGVTINLVCPGLHATDRAKEVGRAGAPRMGDPGDLGKIVAFLCSARTGFITGTTVVVDGGQVRGL